MRNSPMCMNQYHFLFNCCRIPEEPTDYVLNYDIRKNHHIIVLRRNRMYSFDLVVNGRRLSTAEMER